MQDRITKYGLDPMICMYLCTDMSLHEIRKAIFKSYSLQITNGDIEVYFKYNRENPLYQKYLIKKEEEDKLRQ
jgi:hypothetical protein